MKKALSPQARAALIKTCATKQKALAKLAKKEGKRITWGGLQSSFLRAGLPGPASFLAPPREPAREISPSPDPVTATAVKQAEKREKEKVKEAISELGVLREAMAARASLASAPLPTIRRRELGSGLREGTAVVLASDWHVEEQVRKEETPVGNIYTLAIAEERIGRFFTGSEWLVRFARERRFPTGETAGFQLRDMVLWLGGDLLTGHIHEELRETAALAPIQTLLWLKPRLIAGIDQLLSQLKLENLLVVCSHGNHSRDTQKIRRATGADHSYEYGMYCDLAEHFKKDKRVRVHATPAGHQYVKVYDFNLHFHHGDEIRYGGGVGGLSVPLNKAVYRWDRIQKAHYHHVGHFHQFLDGGNWLVNGSLIGYNAYAMSIQASPEPPQQAFYILDSKRGKTCLSPIWASKTAT